MTDQLKAGRVRKLLKQMMPDQSAAPSTPESKPKGDDLLLEDGTSDDESETDPKTGKKRKKTKRDDDLGTDVPTWVDATY